MACLKCGRKTEERQVFCDSCLQAMEENPVKPGTPVLLPTPRTSAAAKKQNHRKRTLPPEEQVIHLRRALRRMYVCVAVLILVLGLATVFLVREILEQGGPVIGQNYTIDTTLNTE